MNDGLENLDQVQPEPSKSVSFTEEQQRALDGIVKSRLAREREKWETASQQSHLPAGAGGSPALTAEQIRQTMREELLNVQKEAQEKAQAAAANEMGKKIYESYQSKMSRGEGKYTDFSEKTGKLPLQQILPIVQLAAEVDNTEDVMYELANNKGKIGNILSLYRESPTLAMQAMSDLSQSIKANESAKGVQHSQPLSKIKPSATAVDNGSPSVQDLLKADWIRR